MHAYACACDMVIVSKKMQYVQVQARARTLVLCHASKDDSQMSVTVCTYPDGNQEFARVGCALEPLFLLLNETLGLFISGPQYAR